MQNILHRASIWLLCMQVHEADQYVELENLGCEMMIRHSRRLTHAFGMRWWLVIIYCALSSCLQINDPINIPCQDLNTTPPPHTLQRTFHTHTHSHTQSTHTHRHTATQKRHTKHPNTHTQNPHIRTLAHKIHTYGHKHTQNPHIRTRTHTHTKSRHTSSQSTQKHIGTHRHTTTKSIHTDRDTQSKSPKSCDASEVFVGLLVSIFVHWFCFDCFLLTQDAANICLFFNASYTT